MAAAAAIFVYQEEREGKTGLAMAGPSGVKSQGRALSTVLGT